MTTTTPATLGQGTEQLRDRALDALRACGADITALPGTGRIDVRTPLTGGTVATLAAAGPDEVHTVDEPVSARRRGPDPVTLLVGLATLAMAVFAFTGQLPDLGFVDPRWLLAGGAVVVGLALLVDSLRGRRHS